jgi:hypothetical protein
LDRDFQKTRDNPADMCDRITDLECLLDYELTTYSFDGTSISHLTACLSIEAGLVEDEYDLAKVAREATFRVKLVVSDPPNYIAFALIARPLQTVVRFGKAALNLKRCLGCGCFIAPRNLPMLTNEYLVFHHIACQVMLLGHLLCQVWWKAVRSV